MFSGKAVREQLLAAPTASRNAPPHHTWQPIATTQLARLFEDNLEKLKLTWLAGHAGGTKDLAVSSSKARRKADRDTSTSFIQLDTGTRFDAVDIEGSGTHTVSQPLSENRGAGPGMFCSCRDRRNPPALKEVAEATSTPIFTHADAPTWMM